MISERAYEQLRDRIVTLRLAPGTVLREDELMSELGIGRTPLREAIKRLALENLISVYPRRGTFVTEINITDLADISDVRVQLEGHAAYRAAQRLTQAQREELDGLLEQVSRPEGDLMGLDAEVHRFIYRCAGNPYLRETLERYLNLSLRIWYLVLARLPHLFERVLEHRDLLLAIRGGDAEGARVIAAEHVATFEVEIRSVLWPTTS